MFFVVRSNDSFNFLLGLIKYIVLLLLLLFIIRVVIGVKQEVISKKNIYLKLKEEDSHSE